MSGLFLVEIVRKQTLNENEAFFAHDDFLKKNIYNDPINIYQDMPVIIDAKNVKSLTINVQRAPYSNGRTQYVYIYNCSGDAYDSFSDAPVATITIPKATGSSTQIYTETIDVSNVYGLRYLHVIFGDYMDCGDVHNVSITELKTSTSQGGGSGVGSWPVID